MLHCKYKLCNHIGRMIFNNDVYFSQYGQNLYTFNVDSGIKIGKGSVVSIFSAI